MRNQQADAQERGGHPRRGEVSPHLHTLLDGAALWRAFNSRLCADVRDFRAGDGEYDRLCTEYLDEKAAGDPDRRRRRALYQRLVELTEDRVALRASAMTWYEALHIIDPSIRAKMLLINGTWPLPEIMPLKAYLAERAEQWSEPRSEPLSDSDSRPARDERQISGRRIAGPRPPTLRLLPPPSGRVEARQHTAGLPARDGRRDHRGPSGVA